MDTDGRFIKVTRDPRFKKVPREHRKVKIDPRFQKMFTDKRFTTKYFMDKRGSKLETTSHEDLRKFYELSDEEEDIEEHSEQPTKENRKIKRNERKKKGNKRDFQPKKEKEKMKGKKEKLVIKKKKEQKKKINHEDDDDERFNVDFARGEGAVESTSDGDDDNDDLRGGDYARGKGIPESSDEEDGIELAPLNMIQTDVEHNWGELDSNALTTDKATRRLAVCNMDWDIVTASDLLVMFNSVKPSGSAIHSVKIYPSEFGLERMKSEDFYGPEEMQDCDKPHDSDAKEEGDAFSQEKLRQYQINRLKYYYAIVECDSCQTASYLYEECDGVEFELSANILDLRFIPDEMEFEHEPKSVCTETPLMSTYEPMNFMTTALNQSNVKVTWDETDPGRLRATMRKFDKKDLLDMDFKAYLASSSDNDDDIEDEILDNQECDFGNDDDDDDDKRITKYKQLLQEINKKEEADDNENDMAITWEPGLQVTAQQLVSRKMKEKKEDKLTPWEKYLRDKKQKRKERREKNKSSKSNEKEINQNDARGATGISDDELPSDVDLSDPFFSQEGSSRFNNGQAAIKNKEAVQKRKSKRSKKLSEEDKKKQDELELLMMDNEDNKKHFSLKKILESEKKNKKKMKRKQDEITEDTFQIDVKDPRFDALYTSHHFLLDPSDPQFRKTKAFENILEEKQKRRKLAEKNVASKNEEQRHQEKRKDVPAKDPSLSLLVKSIKSKTGQFNEQKKKRKSPLS